MPSKSDTIETTTTTTPAPPFTEDQLNTIKASAKLGLNQGEIGLVLGYTKETMSRKMKVDEIAKDTYSIGRGQFKRQLMSRVYTRAMDDERRDCMDASKFLINRIDAQELREEGIAGDEGGTGTVVNIVLETRSRAELIADGEIEE